jgi:hypothetical protein
MQERLQRHSDEIRRKNDEVLDLQGKMMVVDSTYTQMQNHVRGLAAANENAVVALTDRVSNFEIATGIVRRDLGAQPESFTNI